MLTERNMSSTSNQHNISSNQSKSIDNNSSTTHCSPGQAQSCTNTGYYSPEGGSKSYLTNSQLYANASTESLYNQLKTHSELAVRMANEVFDRRKEELTTFKQEYTKKLEEQKSLYERQLAKQNEAHQQEFNRLKHETEAKIKNLEIQLAERVAAQNALEKSNKEKYDSLNKTIAEKNLRINKIELDYEELQRKYTELQKEKQELQHEHDNLNEQVQRIKSMMLGVGSNKKRRLTEIL